MNFNLNLDFKFNFKDLKKKEKIKVIILSILILLITIGTIFATVFYSIIKKSPPTNLKNLSSSFEQTSYIYDEKGELLEKIDARQYRTILSIDEIPKVLQDAFVSIEDQRFCTHHGIDLKSIAGATLTNIKSRNLVRGGSTITQQLVKNVYLTNEKTLTRKIREAYLALRVESVLSKPEILEGYLNRIDLGQGAFGVEAASQSYFSKHAKDINLAQAALLAGIAKSPVEYPPVKRLTVDNFNKDKNKLVGTTVIDGIEYNIVLNDKAFERQKIVLKKMLDLGKITEAEYKEALDFDIVGSIKPGIKKYHQMSSYSTDFIKAQATRELMKLYNVSADEAEYKLLTNGYHIISSIDKLKQNQLENVYENLKTYIENGGESIGLSINIDANENIIDSAGNLVYLNHDKYFDENFNLKLSKEDYSISKSNDLSINKNFLRVDKKIDIVDTYKFSDKSLVTYSIQEIKVPENSFKNQKDYIVIDHAFLKDNPTFYKIVDDNLIISNEFINADRTPITQPESASLITDVQTGYIRAIVGGLDTKSKNQKIFNRAYDSTRNPGSLLKPFSVYLASLLKGDRLSDVVDDVPMFIDGNMWPSNEYPGYKGLLTRRLALENNSNVAAVKILKEVGFKKSVETLKLIGLINENDRFITSTEDSNKNDETLDGLGLGNLHYGFSPFDMTNAYLTVARLGDYKKPTSIIKIIDSSGESLIDNSNTKGKRIYKETIGHLLRDALRTNVTRGELKPMARKYDQGAMMGINKDRSDMWLSGFTNDYVITTWFGADSPKIEVNVDKDYLINFYKEIEKIAQDGELPDKFKTPDGIVKKFICEKSGKLGTKLCEEAQDGYLESFEATNVPTEYCDGHVKLLICNSSGRLAGEYCPKEDVELKILFKRNPPYNSKDHGGIYPDDYQYVPSLYCNVHDEDWYMHHKKRGRR